MDIIKQNQPRLLWIHKDETETQTNMELYHETFENDSMFKEVM